MPVQVPVLDGPQQTLRPLTNERFQAPDIGQAGRTLGEGMESLAGGVADAAKASEEIHNTYAEARAKQLDNEYQQHERDLLFGNDQTGTAGYYTKQNADALNARQPLEEQLAKLRGDLIARTQDKTERRMLETVLNQRGEETANGIARYASGQAHAYADLQSNARIGNAQENYIRFADTDPKVAAQNRATILSELESQAQRNGWQDPNIIALKKEAALSDMHQGYIEAQIVNDPAKAAAYLEKNRAEIDPAKAAVLDGRLQPLLVDHDAHGFKEMAKRLAGPFDAPVTEADPTVPGASKPSALGLETVWSKMVGRESGGHQLDSRGLPLTSSKGAIGKAQVMPATAQQMAQTLGIAWDENRYKTDPAYNERLGKAYFATLLTTFHGDVRKAVAAYNAGPGSAQRGVAGVRGAMRRGGLDWEQHLPEETKAYLDHVMGSSRPVAHIGGPSAQVQAEGSLAAQLQWAEDAIPQYLAGKPERYIEMVVDKTKAEIRDDYETKKLAIDAQTDALKENVYEQVFSMGPDFTDIGQLRGANALPVGTRMTLDNLARANRKSALETRKATSDDGFFANLSDLYASDPKGLLGVDPATARAKLSDSDYKTYVGWRRDVLQDQRAGTLDPKRATADDILKNAQTSLAAVGLTMGTVQTSSQKKQVAQMQDQFVGAMQRWTGHFRAQNGREPTSEEIRKQGDVMLLQGAWHGGQSGFVFQGYNEGYFEGNKGSKIIVPDSIDARIRKAAPHASDAEVRQLYIQGVHQGRFPLVPDGD